MIRIEAIIIFLLIFVNFFLNALIDVGLRPVSQSVTFAVRLIRIGRQYDKNWTDLQGKVTYTMQAIKSVEV